MIPSDRLARLQYMADHLGHTEAIVNNAMLRGVDVLANPHGPMIAVSHSELRILLEAYSKQSEKSTSE